jgi:hypothetical protein
MKWFSRLTKRPHTRPPCVRHTVIYHSLHSSQFTIGYIVTANTTFDSTHDFVSDMLKVNQGSNPCIQKIRGTQKWFFPPWNPPDQNKTQNSLAIAMRNPTTFYADLPLSAWRAKNKIPRASDHDTSRTRTYMTREKAICPILLLHVPPRPSYTLDHGAFITNTHLNINVTHESPHLLNEQKKQRY